VAVAAGAVVAMVVEVGVVVAVVALEGEKAFASMTQMGLNVRVVGMAVGTEVVVGKVP
jgi:hypothetical protein